MDAFFSMRSQISSLVGEHLALGVLAPFPWLSGEGRVDPDARGFLEFAHFVGFTARLG